MTYLSDSEGFVAFGFKQHWLAIPDSDPSAVATALGLRKIRPATWAEGIARLDGAEPNIDQTVFVAPPIERWTLAIAGTRGIPQAEDPNWIPFLEHLSASQGHVQYLGTHRIVGYVAWARAENGRLVRAFAYSGESGRTLVNLGQPTLEESELGIDFLDERTASDNEIKAHKERTTELERAIHQYTLQREPETLNELERSIVDRLINKYNMSLPSEDSVMLVAGLWSIDPSQLEHLGEVAELGLLGSR